MDHYNEDSLVDLPNEETKKEEIKLPQDLDSLEELVKKMAKLEDETIIDAVHYLY